MDNQTSQNDQINRVKKTKKELEIALRSVWQGLMDDYRTYCGIVCFSKEEKDV